MSPEDKETAENQRGSESWWTRIYTSVPLCYLNIKTHTPLCVFNVFAAFFVERKVCSSFNLCQLAEMHRKPEVKASSIIDSHLKVKIFMLASAALTRFTACS